MVTGWFPPLAPLPGADGTIFRVLCRKARRVFLHLYGPARTLELSEDEHRCGDVWEVLVPGVGAGRRYAWSLDGRRPLVDPYALAVDGPARFGSDDPDRPRPPLEELNRDAAFKSVVVAPPPRMAAGPRRPWRETVIYEAHVRGLTRHPSADVDAAGTYRALAAKAPYLRELGVTAVELLPVHEFDETEVRRGEGLFNFWGYSPVAWCAPNRRYAVRDPVAEFREMVAALHAEGLEVYLDVVFNHTAELDADGPTWNLRALDDEVYYLHEARTDEWADLTGCGNTVKAQHPTVRALIRHALRWWVHGLGVDGFRFDLATILCRDERGEILEHPPLVRELETDPWLAGVRLIAEAWDAAGGYLVGDWPGNERWAVWNDRFRDDVRRAWLDAGTGAHALADRLCGSSDVFGEGPLRGVNYVTSHDGFTLRDVVSYSRKHNDANGEDGRDGHSHEVSCNHGVEGPSDDPEIRAARDQARRNLAASLLLAQGVPMLPAGDEFGRTQRGNNNAYCHDSDLTWVDWTGLDRDAAFHAFLKRLLALRRACASLKRTTFLGGAEDGDIEWFGPDGDPVDWESGCFGYRLSGGAAHTGGDADEPDLTVLVNLGADETRFALPGAGPWRLAVDTARPEKEGSAHARGYPLAGKSLVALRGDA